jgi:hypothetical protein
MDRINLFLLVLLLIACNDTPDVPRATDTNDTTAINPLDTGRYHEYHILPQETDEHIVHSEEPHYAYVDSRFLSKQKLLIFLSGTNSFPKHYQLFSQAAAAEGYHVVNINYINSANVLECTHQANNACFRNFHEEVIFGNAVCDFVSIDSGNSIYNRVLKLLVLLNRDHPEQKWSQFYNGGVLENQKLVLAGHSQGGGHAAYFAYKYPIDRVIVFAAPNDYSEKYARPADWCSSNFATSPDRLYGLLHRRDEIVPMAEQYAIWKVMKLLSRSDTVSADGDAFKGHQGLITNFEPNPDALPKLKHNVPVRDDALPPDASGEQLKLIWRYLLGAE